MFAPVINLTVIVCIAPHLHPVSDSCKLVFGRRTVLPKIKQHRLTGPRAKTRQRRQGATVRADVLPKGHNVIVLIDQCPDILVALCEQHLVDHGICAHIDQPAGF